MHRAVAAEGGRRVSAAIPPIIWQRIRCFLDERKTGQIHLDVKDGRVLSCRLIESVHVHGSEPPLDSNPDRVVDLAR